MKIIRLYFRLVIAYIATNRLYFVLGLAVSLLLIAFPGQLSRFLTTSKPRTIGLAGNYTVSSLPGQVQDLISMGLTRLQPDGEATGAAAISWQATNSGKKVTFFLNKDLKWQDGLPFDSNQVNYNLKSVELTRPSSSEVSFIFQEPFAPLAVTLSQPLFKNGLVGLGDYVAESIKFNGRFISQINLRSRQSNQPLIYKFYATESDLITALKLGSITEIQGLHQTYDLDRDSRYSVSSLTDKATVVTLFFNTQKLLLDEKQVRQALTYALPDEFPGLDRAYAPVPENSWFSSDSFKKYSQNLDGARKIMDKAASQSARPKLIIQTNKILEPVADQISTLWKQIGVSTDVNIIDVLPETYDIYLGFLELPADPDQYALWHSTQQGNISHYKSPKIDKLLEEGRRTLNIAERLNIYSNFQKAITEEVPATFLFYPKIYSITRR